MKNNTKNSSAYDARFSESLGGSEYDDLLIALEHYDEFQSQTGNALKKYIEANCQGFSTIKVLEAGPGTGITTLKLVDADPRVHVVSVDNEAKMLEVVRGRFSKVPELKDRVEFVLSDILTYLESCPDQSFDAFASVYTLHNFTPDFRGRVISQITKKLKRGGVFINGDKYAREGGLHKEDYVGEIGNYDKFLIVADREEKAGNIDRAKHLRKIKEDWIKHCAEDEINKITVVEQENMFKELGFKNIEWGKRFDLAITVSAIKG